MSGSSSRCVAEECSVAVLLCLGAESASESGSESAHRILAQVDDVAVLRDPLGSPDAAERIECSVAVLHREKGLPGMAARDSLTA